MKVIDESYAYDELEGFKPIDLKQRHESPDVLWMSMASNHICLSQAARKTILETEYLQFLWNDQTKQLLLAAAPTPGGASVIKLPRSAKFTGFSCRPIRDLVEQETKRDLDTVRIRLYGTKVKSKRSAVIFDLSSMVVKKIQSEKRRRNEKMRNM